MRSPTPRIIRSPRTCSGPGTPRSTCPRLPVIHSHDYSAWAVAAPQLRRGPRDREVYGSRRRRLAAQRRGSVRRLATVRRRERQRSRLAPGRAARARSPTTPREPPALCSAPRATAAPAGPPIFRSRGAARHPDVSAAASATLSAMPTPAVGGERLPVVAARSVSKTFRVPEERSAHAQGARAAPAAPHPAIRRSGRSTTSRSRSSPASSSGSPGATAAARARC